ncbi:acyl-CoA thioesterase II [Desulfosarcina ovata subsp. sediminis]|uniref:Acyl-CoA thioesterase 2 n=1 Tax=Desulfosarcina ovata subsp. sediminis TaxID=885957 RepID=A0A5K8A152_9BACT|nr:acyl-CoA thioesterase II [Desulfosarcina ovata]BBO86050.1 acyl-CoA thioesterase II [Desulfosarcina ovata subsp. sediminis]
MSVCVEKNVLEELLQLLKLEKIEENIFRGQSQDLGYRAVFGGQVLGQALSAASQTVPADRHTHSLHAYFMRPGDATKPIVYTVDCIRDGKSFTTRRVVAVQKGHAIFFMSASYQVVEPGFGHQKKMPDVQGPTGLEPDIEMARRLGDHLPPGIREKVLCDKPIELRPIDPIDPSRPEKKAPSCAFWFRAIGPMPDDPAVHQYMLAYASDFGMVPTSLRPHGHTVWNPEIQTASLDHAMWFHRDFRMDNWMLFEMNSPSASGARGLTVGRFFTREGVLVASVAQEGLIRYHKDDA